MKSARMQGGGIGWLVVWALAATVLVLTMLFEQSPAPAEDVKALASLAATSPQATAILQDGLKQAPTPSRRELADLKSQVDERVVLETSRALTGDHSLRPTSEVMEEDRRRVEAEAEAAFNEISARYPFMPYLLGVMCLAAVVVVAVRTFKSNNQ